MRNGISVLCFRPVHPNDRDSTQTDDCSLRLLIRAATLGVASVGVRIISAIEIECFALNANVKRSHHFCYAILCDVFGRSKKLCIEKYKELEYFLRVYSFVFEERYAMENTQKRIIELNIIVNETFKYI